jgi:GDPmannose 4,6-dehydratase
VEAMWLMLQQEKPDDYIIATGETHSVKEFVNLAFNRVGMELEWRGGGVNEKRILRSFASNLKPLTSTCETLPLTLTSSSALSIGDAIIEIDPRYLRPLEVEVLQGDASKAMRTLN